MDGSKTHGSQEQRRRRLYFQTVCCLHPRTRTGEEDMVMSVVFEK